MPFVSILVLNWNGEAYIGECINSLLSQTYPNYELIVIDNGSTDSSIDILRGFVPRIRLILNDKNLGFAAGNNVGLREVKGELIVLFNSDAIADGEWLARLVDGLLSPPEADIASGPIYYYEPRDVLWCAGGRIDMLTGLAWHLGQYDRELSISQDIDYFPGCALMIKKEVFQKIGLLDERFFLYAEDPDFCLRAKGAGFKLKLVPHARVWHMVSMAMKREPEPTQERKLESEFKLILKLWPRWCLPITLFLRLSVIPLLQRSLRLTWRAYRRARGEKREAYRRGSLPLHIRFGECLRVARRRRRVRGRGKMRESLMSVYQRIFPPPTNYLKKELSDCTTLLDLGCGNNSPLQYISVTYSVGVEIFKPYLEQSKEREIHSEYILADIRKIEFKKDSFDAVLLWDILEHLSVEEGYELIKRAQSWAKVKVIIFTPNGIVWQNEYDNNPWQAHKSGWRLVELKELGFKAYGMAGWKALRGYKAQLRFKPAVLWRVISDMTQKMTYFRPGYAFQLLCVWRKQ